MEAQAGKKEKVGYPESGRRRPEDTNPNNADIALLLEIETIGHRMLNHVRMAADDFNEEELLPTPQQHGDVVKQHRKRAESCDHVSHRRPEQRVLGFVMFDG